MSQSKTKQKLKQSQVTGNENEFSTYGGRDKNLYARASFGVNSKGYPTNFSSIYYQRRG